MKDYTVFKKDRKNFILYYKIDGNNIIVKYAKGKKIIPNTLNNRKQLLEKMKDQVKKANYDDFEGKQLKSIKNSFILIFSLVMVLGISIICDFIFFYPVIASWFIGVIYGTNKIINSKSKIDDYRKSLYFLENIEIFENLNVNKLRKSLASKISKVRENSMEHTLVLNNIDSFTEQELTDIVDDIKIIDFPSKKDQTNQNCIKRLIKQR